MASSAAGQDAFPLQRAASIIESVPRDHPVGAALHTLLEHCVPLLLDHVNPVVADQAALQGAVCEDTAAIRRPVVEGAEFDEEVKAPLKLADRELMGGSIGQLEQWAAALPQRVREKVLGGEVAEAIGAIRAHFEQHPVGKEAPMLMCVLEEVLKRALGTATAQDDNALEAPRAAAEQLVGVLRAKSEAIQRTSGDPYKAPAREQHRNERLPRAIALLENMFARLGIVSERLGSDGLESLSGKREEAKVLVSACSSDLTAHQKQQEGRVATYQEKKARLRGYVGGLKEEYLQQQQRVEESKPLFKSKQEAALAALRKAVKDLDESLEEERWAEEQLEDARVKLQEGEALAAVIDTELDQLMDAHQTAAQRWATGQQVVSDIDKLAEGVVVRARTHLLDSCEAMLRDAPVDAHKCTGFLQQVINELKSQRQIRQRKLVATHQRMVALASDMESWHECPDLDFIPEDAPVVGDATVARTNRYELMEQQLRQLKTLYARQKDECKRLDDCTVKVEAKTTQLAERSFALAPQTQAKKAGTNGAVLLQERPALLQEPETFSQTDGTSWATEFFFTHFEPLRVLDSIPDLDVHAAHVQQQMQLSFTVLNSASAVQTPSSAHPEAAAAADREVSVATEQSELDMGDWDEIRSTITDLTAKTEFSFAVIPHSGAGGAAAGGGGAPGSGLGGAVGQ